MKYIASALMTLICSSTVLVSNLYASTDKSIQGTQWLGEWQEERSEDGISSQCRQHVSKIMQCRFKTLVNESSEALTAVIQDAEGFKEWAVSVLISDRVIYDEADPDTYVYTTYNFTGAYNRDALSRYSLKTDMDGRRNRINFITVDKPYDNQDLRLVRFPLMAGYWQFTKLENGQTEIEHQSFTQPGGLVQSTLYHLFNIAYLDSSFDTIRALLKQAKKAKYQAHQNTGNNIVAIQP
jgi:hypothetical protein